MTKVLIFGSGYIVVAIVDYLSTKKDIAFTIATRSIDEAKKIAKQLDIDITIEKADVTDEEKCRELTRQNDIVISMVPPSFHPYVLDYCIKEKTNLAVASYLKEEITKRNQEAKDAGISCLFEVGLDPGIDHIVTMHMINEVKKNKGTVQSLLSLCGGLVAPHCITNPLCYKSSWSIEGPFKALSDAKFLKNGEVVNISKEDLLYSEQQINVNNAICTYYYSNRDSVKYKDIYNIPDSKFLQRGTIRFKGFIENVATFLEFGLLDNEEKDDIKEIKIIDYIKDKIKDEDSELKNVSEDMYKKAKNQFDEQPDLDLKKFTNFVTKNKNWNDMDDQKKQSRLNLIFQGFEKLELFNKDSVMKSEKSQMTSFINFLSKFLIMKEGETDFIIMDIELESSYDDGRKEKQIFYLQTQGNPNTYSAMSKYVGYPCAIAVELILDGTIDKKGVFGPFTEDVFNPLYNKLVEEKMINPVHKKTFDPKL